MARTKRGVKARRRHNRVLKFAKGFSFDRRTKFRHAAETVKRALHYAYNGRKQLKQDMRGLWITRISAGLASTGISYSKFMHQLKAKNCGLNRKMLADLVACHLDDFLKLQKIICA